MAFTEQKNEQLNHKLSQCVIYFGAHEIVLEILLRFFDRIVYVIVCNDVIVRGHIDSICWYSKDIKNFTLDGVLIVQ
jgi:hypothetical protein